MQVKLNCDNKLVGTLVNHTGYDLWHVFLAYKQPAFAEPTATSSRDTDAILYVNRWAKDDSLKLEDLIVSKNLMDLEDLNRRQPMGADPAYGQMGGVQKLAYAWSSFWRGERERGGERFGLCVADADIFRSVAAVGVDSAFGSV